MSQRFYATLELVEIVKSPKNSQPNKTFAVFKGGKSRVQLQTSRSDRKPMVLGNSYKVTIETA